VLLLLLPFCFRSDIMARRQRLSAAAKADRAKRYRRRREASQAATKTSPSLLQPTWSTSTVSEKVAPAATCRGRPRLRTTMKDVPGKIPTSETVTSASQAATKTLPSSLQPSWSMSTVREKITPADTRTACLRSVVVRRRRLSAATKVARARLKYLRRRREASQAATETSSSSLQPSWSTSTAREKIAPAATRIGLLRLRITMKDVPRKIPMTETITSASSSQPPTSLPENIPAVVYNFILVRFL